MRENKTRSRFARLFGRPETAAAAMEGPTLTDRFESPSWPVDGASRRKSVTLQKSFRSKSKPVAEQILPRRPLIGSLMKMSSWALFSTMCANQHAYWGSGATFASDFNASE